MSSTYSKIKYHVYDYYDGDKECFLYVRSAEDDYYYDEDGNLLFINDNNVIKENLIQAIQNNTEEEITPDEFHEVLKRRDERDKQQRKYNEEMEDKVKVKQVFTRIEQTPEEKLMCEEWNHSELAQNMSRMWKDALQRRHEQWEIFAKEKMNLYLKWHHKLLILLNKKLVRKYVKFLEQQTSISELSKLGVQIYDKQYWMYE